jgi:hypothetical protein
MKLIYPYEDFKNCKIVESCPETMIAYRAKNKKPNKAIFTTFNNLMKNIINRKLSNMDAVEYENSKLIKSNINSLCSSSYDNTLKTLNKINYNENLIVFLINTLITSSIKCPICIKCKIFNESDIDTDTIPVLCCLILRDINHDIKNPIEQCILTKFNKLLQSQYDIYNEDTIEAYRGLLTFVGILYIYNVLSFEFIVTLINIILDKLDDKTSNKSIENKQILHSSLFYGLDNLLKCIIYTKTDLKYIKSIYTIILNNNSSTLTTGLIALIKNQMRVLQNM